MADYVVPDELPAFSPYLRSGYRNLPAPAVEELGTLVQAHHQTTRLRPAGPAPGEDEQPEQAHEIKAARRSWETSNTTSQAPPLVQQSVLAMLRALVPNRPLTPERDAAYRRAAGLTISSVISRSRQARLRGNRHRAAARPGRPRTRTARLGRCSLELAATR